ncbi:MaoC/PaaZ C-terminal domain-containing protein [Cellulomonas sp. URHD0024]|uniref:MaoC/PaaZ C-terminal domain-containing protein n=1 Tax=Cellulomonas sp. URHD0024 TaxID=1302620 RepID=UPI00040C0FA0|nr:MaoC/PaaZ C-terminal domain-containing protein [Cellulomonas sp. URHD0024]
MTVVVLPGVPGAGGLYLRGAVSSGGLAIRRRVDRAPRDLPDVAYVVRGVRADPDRLTEFQHLLGESASDALPAGFVHALAFPVTIALMARPDFPLPVAGMVHLSNQVTQTRPLTLGEPFDVRATAADLRAHRTGTQVDLVTTVSTGDDIAWRGVSTYLARGLFLRGQGPDDRSTFDPPTPTGQWVLGADTGRRYAAVSGDHNPIHVSSLAAKAFGFPRAIAHGMYTASRALASVGPARGDAFDWSVSFAKPVLLPSTVNVRIAPSETGFSVAAWSSVPHLTGSVTPLA